MTQVVPAGVAQGEGVRVAGLLRLGVVGIVVGNLARVPLVAEGQRAVPLLVNDLFVGALLVLGALVIARARLLRVDGVVRAASGFVMVGLLAAAVATVKYDLGVPALLVSAGYLARWAVYFGVYVVAINTMERGDVPPTWTALERGVMVFAAFGIVQSIFLPGFAQLVYPDSRIALDWDAQGHRLVSTFLDPNFAGALLLMVLLPQLAQLALGAPVALWKPLMLLAAVLLTASRSTLLALAAGGIMIVATTGLSRKLVQLGGIVAALLLAALPRLIEFANAYHKLGFDPSAMARVQQWARALRVFIDNPVIGVGFNTWGFVQERYGWERLHAATYSLDGGVLFVAVLTGVVGLTLFLAMMVRVIRAGRVVSRRGDLDPATRGIALGTAALTAAMIVHSLFTNSLLLPLLMEPMFLCWAMVAVLARTLPPPAAPGVDRRAPRESPRLVALLPAGTRVVGGGAR